MKRYRKPVAIIINSRTHRGRTYGNPYSRTVTTVIYRDGSHAECTTPRQYDSEGNCPFTAFKELERAGLIRDWDHATPPMWARANGIFYMHNSCEVARERDL